MLIDKKELEKQVRQGKISSLDDLNSVLRNIIKDVVETTMGAELTGFLGYEKNQPSDSDNFRNGYSPKELSSKLGNVIIDVPRDRKSEFQPALVKKRQKDISGLENSIISMYAKGLSTRDIQEHVKELYEHDISAETVSRITDSVLEKAKEWQNRPLQPAYAIVFLDALFLKMRQDGRVRNVAVYLMVGIDLSGNKECLGIWIGQTESSKYWLAVLNEIKNRGVNDVLIFSVDGLPGFPESIKAVFPHSEIQRCLVHQVRYSLLHVSWKDRKPIATALKAIYTAPTEESGLAALESFEEAWGDIYPHIVQSWQRNWDELAAFFKYPDEVRRLVYTTNPIESLNSQVKKIIGKRGAFPSEIALYKILFLAVSESSRKWTMRMKEWPAIFSQLAIFFQERMEKYIF